MNLENSAVRSLPAPEYSEEELDKIFQYFMTLKSDLIREFLSGKDLQKSGTKSDLAELISKYLQDGDITYSDLVNYLDTVTPYMKQHIHIFDGPESRVLDSWRDPAKVSDLLKRNNLIELLNSRLPLILPQSLSISSIVYLPEKTLTVYSVERREYFERREEYDKKIIENGEEIELRAHCHNIGRGFVIFRWDLIENTALLQISQLESGSDYEQVVENFSQLVQPWLDLSIFQKLDLRRVITKLNELEQQGHPEARSHSFGYETHGGRLLSAQSPNYQYSVFGEQEVDPTLKALLEYGIGHLGNFYWLPASKNPDNGNPLEKDIHTVIVGHKQRINFTTPNKKGDMEYVLSRVRALSN